jgi:hypothetical protein
MSEPTIQDARVLCELMANDAALWDTEGVRIETAYVQQGLRYLTHYIEGEWTFKQTYDALKEMQP